MNAKPILFSALLVPFVVLPSMVLGWGGGHNVQIEWAMKLLPAEVRDFWNAAQKEKMIARWSHYPDGPSEGKAFFSPEEEALMGDDLPYIARATKKIRNSLHSPIGKGVMFFALAKAFRENKPDKAALYAGTLMHSYADGGAFNHGSMMQYLEYTRYKNVKYPAIPHADLSVIRNDEKVLSRVRDILGDFKPDTKVKRLDDALVNVMMTGVVSTKFLAEVEAYLGKVNPDGSPSTESSEAIAKTLDIQARDGAHILNSAWLIAKSDQPLNPASLDIAFNDLPASQRPVYSEFEKRRREYLNARDARDDSVYRGLFAADVKYPAVGFIAEAAYEMGEGDHGFGARFATAIIARGMENSGKSVKLFSFPEFEKEAPDVKSIPVLVLHSTRGISPRLRKSLDAYLDRGGRLIFIGGDDQRLTKMKMQKHADAETPVSTKWGVQNADVIGKMRIELGPQLATVKKENPFGFNDNPNQIGWNKPIANFEIVPDADTEPLAYLHLPDGRKYCIAAVRRSGGESRSMYVPAYLLLPFMFSDEKVMKDWSLATTDSFGNAIITAAVDIMEKGK